MSTIYLITHNLIRWGVVIFGLWTLVQAISGVMSKRAYNKKDKLSSLVFSIFCDIQLLLGLVLLFTSTYFDQLKSVQDSMRKEARFFIFEHALMMIIAWIIVHVGTVMVKKAAENAKHKKMLIFFGLAILIIIASIPWPFRHITLHSGMSF